MSSEHELGAFVGRYATDNVRRRKIFAIAVPLGVVAALYGVMSLVFLADTDSPGAMMLPAVACGAGLGALGVGAYQGVLSFTRRDEAFDLYEGGLVHACADHSSTIAWAQIAKVSSQGQDYALHRMLGLDVYYRIKLTSSVGGRRVIAITGVTDDADRLGDMVREAVQNGTPPRRNLF